MERRDLMAQPEGGRAKGGDGMRAESDGGLAGVKCPECGGPLRIEPRFGESIECVDCPYDAEHSILTSCPEAAR